MSDAPISHRTSNPGFDDRWTCPGCYRDLPDTRPGSAVCPGCGRTVILTVDYQPVSHSVLLAYEEPA